MVKTIGVKDSAGIPRTVYTLPEPLLDSVGDPINPDNWPQTLTYSGSNVTSVSFTDGTNTWTQTFTYTGSNITGISKWVKA